MDTIPATLLRIYTSESDRMDGMPAHEAILALALKQGLAGGTVLHGIAGFGNRHRLHTSHVLRLAEDLPLVTELVDEQERIETFVQLLEPRLHGGIITLEQVRVLTGGADPSASLVD